MTTPYDTTPTDESGATRAEPHAHSLDDPPPAPPPTPIRADDDDTYEADTTGDEARTSVLRVPAFSPLAPVLGWILAWGAIAIATAVLFRAEIETGFNLGIADGGPGADGLWPGVWLVVVSGGAFLLGGYTAARLARAKGTTHALLVWVVAMAATAVDGIYESVRDATVGVVQLIPGVPYWGDTGLTGEAEAITALAIFAAAALVGALFGGALGQTANRAARTDDAVVHTRA